MRFLITTCWLVGAGGGWALALAGLSAGARGVNPIVDLIIVGGASSWVGMLWTALRPGKSPSLVQLLLAGASWLMPITIVILREEFSSNFIFLAFASAICVTLIVVIYPSQSYSPSMGSDRRLEMLMIEATKKKSGEEPSAMIKPVAKRVMAEQAERTVASSEALTMGAEGASHRVTELTAAATVALGGSVDTDAEEKSVSKSAAEVASKPVPHARVAYTRNETHTETNSEAVGGAPSPRGSTSGVSSSSGPTESWGKFTPRSPHGNGTVQDGIEEPTARRADGAAVETARQDSETPRSSAHQAEAMERTAAEVGEVSRPRDHASSLDQAAGDRFAGDQLGSDQGTGNKPVSNQSGTLKSSSFSVVADASVAARKGSSESKWEIPRPRRKGSLTSPRRGPDSQKT